MIGFNMFVFTFKEEEDASRVLKENPWVVRNYMLSLQKRKPFLSDNEIQINKCEFWIQFHNIPPEGRMGSNVELMAKLVGNVIEIENPEEKRFSNRGVCRARVEIDIDKPLVLGFSAPRPDHNLEDIWIQVRYEKLVRFCYNCGKLGHESKGCEDEAVEFMVNGVLKGYDAGLCAQVFRPPATTQGNWNQGRTSDVRGTHGEGKNNNSWTGDGGSRYGSKGEGSGWRESREGIKYMQSNRPELDTEAKCVDERLKYYNNMGNLLSTQMDPTYGLGRRWQSKERMEQPTFVDSAWSFNETNGINSLLRARKEKLKKTQVRYWVELADEEEEGAHTSNAIVPIQAQEIGELAQGFREVSLKRKLVEEREEKDDSPLAKRRKDYRQESPRSAGEKEKAIRGLQIIAKLEGFNRFNYKYEGELSFKMGENSKELIRLRKKAKRGLFKSPDEAERGKFAVRAEAFEFEKGACIYMEEVKEYTSEGCGGWPEVVSSES